ncbi:hypothetical protein [Azospirillum isscasi]|uniref:Lipoprotein n=1 Tax=Azospirillum isscasi TaxID=3053926 RepID=A0ABU0WIK9_9PROT|nr:hypothetical protein [Azospirillum isscasi]MDQ2104058.1 hypothetical protein [Azospirillum isscasi]
MDVRRRPIKRPCATLALALLAGGCTGFQPVRLATAEPGAVAALNRLSPAGCNGTVAAALAGAGIPLSDVRGLVYGLTYGFEYVVRYDAWVALNSQPGAVVVTMDEFCQPIQIYARGGARLPERKAG